jgi:hypothetical protein
LHHASRVRKRNSAATFVSPDQNRACNTAVSSSSLQSVAVNAPDNGLSRHIRHHARVRAGHADPSASAPADAAAPTV